MLQFDDFDASVEAIVSKKRKKAHEDSTKTVIGVVIQFHSERA